MALPKLRADATQARLAALAVPQGEAPWAQAIRAAARARVEALGLPVRRDEYWRYTDPAALNTPEAEPAFVWQDEEAPAWEGVDRLRIVFVDGVFDPAASDPLEEAGLEIERLSQAARKDIHWIRDLWGVLEADGQAPVPRPFAALNTAFAADGVAIRATACVARPVHILNQRRAAGAEAMVRHLVRVEPGAALTLLESGPGAARFNQVLEAEIGAGGALHHVRSQGRDRERRVTTHLFARLAGGAELRSFTLSLNGRLTRNEAVVRIEGDGAVAHVAGAATGDGAEFHHDDTVFITHDAVGCESRQVFKKVLRHGATGVFQGKILVKPGAQKTDGYQISQALLLDEDSQFLAKPELEIHADDVKCSHGSTSAALDPVFLFYLRSRGVPLAEAKDMLTLAFLAEAMDEIADPRLAEDLHLRLEGWLARRRG